MQVVTIDPTKNLAEIAESMGDAFTAIKDRHGWDGTAQALENVVLRMAVEDWAAKSPGSVGRLKRIHRAVTSNQA